MDEQIFSINTFGGINLSSTPSTIGDNESPDMVNFMVDSTGMLIKRKGYVRAAGERPSEQQPIRSFYSYRGKDGKEVLLVAAGSMVYRYTNEMKDVGIAGTLSSMTGNVLFFALNNLIYMLDDTKVYQYKDTTDPRFDPVVGYAPTVTMSMAPGGSGETLEDINLIDNAFKCKYSADGTSKTYQLTKVTDGVMANYADVTVDGVSYGRVNAPSSSNDKFSVDWNKWQITFVTAPPKGTNNVVIQVCYPVDKMVQNRLMITKCSLYTTFGGNNDTRVFLAGNPEYPNRIFRSGLLDPSYFPVNGFYDIGTNDQPITAFAKQYDSLVILKSSSIYLMNFQVSNGEPVFSTLPLNDKIGCIAPRSIELLENSPVWLSNAGVYSLAQTEIRNERNVTLLSGKVDARLRDELNKGQAVAIDYDNKYIIKINQICYVMDYKLGIWYIWDNLPVDKFFVVENKLFFSDTTGKIYRMYLAEGEAEIDDSTHYLDNGESIKAYWYSKEWDFNQPYYLKNIKKLFYTAIPTSKAGLQIWESYKDDGDTLIHEKELDKEKNFIAWGTRVKLRAKKLQRYQIIIKSERAEELLALKDLGFEYLVIKYVKR